MSRARLICSGVLTQALVLLAPIALAQAQPAAPLRTGRNQLELTPGQRLRRAPLGRRLPGPGQVRAGRYLSLQHAARGPRAAGQVGDYFVRSPQLLVVLRASDGALVDVATGPEFVDGFGWGRQQICAGDKRYEGRLLGIGLIGGARPALEARSWVPELRVTLRARYRLSGADPVLELESELHNQGSVPLNQLALCETLGLGNTRLQVPAVGEVRRSQDLKALFVARAEAGVSSLLLRPDGRPLELHLELPSPAPAFDPAVEARYPAGPLSVGDRRVIRRLLVVRRGPPHLALAGGLAHAGLARWESTVEVRQPPPQPGDLPSRLLVRRDGAPFLYTEVAPRLKLSLPRGGRYQVGLAVPGVGEGPLVPLRKGAVAVPQRPAAATLVLRVHDEKGKPIPARLLIRGRAPTPDPAFGSDSGRRLANVAYLEAGPETLKLAPGKYQLVVGRGPLYELARADLRLAAGETRKQSFTLRQSVRAAGWLSADLHLHTASSFDSPVRLEERIAAAKALGVDLLVLTDHNVITAGPEAANPASSSSQPEQGGSSPRPLLISGQEVTSQGKLVGHFNVFPLQPGAAIAARDRSPAQIFAEARRRRPAPLIQVNHPRMGSIGYFDRMQLEAISGRAAADYRADFDLLEVFNGDQLAELGTVRSVLRDWYQLLNRGARYVATGGSDSHRLPYQEAGSPRTLIRYDLQGKGGAPSVQALLSALRKGQAVVSSGPLLRFSLGGKPLGALLQGPGPHAMQLQVEAPSWMSLSEVTLLANGEPLVSWRPWPGAGVRLRKRRLLRPVADTWYLVMARGDQPDPTQLRDGVLPFAISNPIFVDVDGDGHCRPPAPTSAPALAR